MFGAFIGATVSQGCSASCDRHGGHAGDVRTVRVCDLVGNSEEKRLCANAVERERRRGSVVWMVIPDVETTCGGTDEGVTA